MNKIITLSLIAAVSIYATEVELTPISVESTVITEVSQNAQTSADLADALSKGVPSIDMNRRSGIANDIYIRGQKRDNISVEVDGTKVCGACVNRMDPPVSHILASQIDEVEVIEGPYDIETFGTMSGGVKITTKKPQQGVHGEINVGYGSWNYTKAGATLSAGNEIVRVLVSASTESSDQYEDGDGNNLAEQIKNYDPANALKAEYEDMKAYEKKSVMSKIYVNVTDDQELRLSVTANRSDNVLYASSKMDALYDDSNIYSVEYNIDNISDLYKNINLQYYYSEVSHPMGTNYRVTSVTNTMVSHLRTTMQGIKLKNSFDLYGHGILFGLDGSERTWDGTYYMNNVPLPAPKTKSIDNSLTKNVAVFAKLDKNFGDLDLSIGARYDSTKITNEGTLQSNDYEAINANILATYNINKENKIFLGIGQASRVPDARELYNIKSNGKVDGTPDLKQTKNQEIDLGYELSNDMFKFKVKGFYSMLSDYIYYKTAGMTDENNFNNIDAVVYGTELSASVYATDEMTIDAGISYKRGQKDKALAGQTDKDLADMAPLRGNLALNYEYMNNSIATLETQFSDKWSNYDADNGEQEISAWGIINMKVKHAINKEFNFTVGVNNLFDKTYAQNNTYVDLILLNAGTDVMLMNEPGRYIYTNLTYKF